MMEKFHYTVPDTKKKITLPSFGHLPFGVIRRIRKADETEQFFLLLEESADERSLKIIDDLSMPEIADLVDAWQKDAGVTVGESSD
ncbi:hypothetical protein [Corynebacterium glyciniphilum]|uniref:hypothetical protein n=1 Tax=Corynebacterium glyciniphilum TaxID=1404244 RepID=UPI003FCF5ED2